MGCHYCGYSGGHHSDDCPKNDPAAIKRFHDGWSEARNRAIKPSSDDKAFNLGFYKGVCALESAQNGHDSWGY